MTEIQKSYFNDILDTTLRNNIYSTGFPYAVSGKFVNADCIFSRYLDLNLKSLLCKEGDDLYIKIPAHFINAILDADNFEQHFISFFPDESFDVVPYIYHKTDVFYYFKEAMNFEYLCVTEVSGKKFYITSGLVLDSKFHTVFEVGYKQRRS